MFYKLKLKDWFYLIVLMVFTYLWINYDQLIISNPNYRMIAFIMLGLILMVLFYFLVKPDKTWHLANTMTIILIPLFILLVVVLHIFILKDGFPKKSIVLWLFTAGMIYLSGLIYTLLHPKKK